MINFVTVLDLQYHIIHPYEVSFEPTRRWMHRGMMHNDTLIPFVGDIPTYLCKVQTFRCKPYVCPVVHSSISFGLTPCIGPACLNNNP